MVLELFSGELLTMPFFFELFGSPNVTTGRAEERYIGKVGQE